MIKIEIGKISLALDFPRWAIMLLASVAIYAATVPNTFQDGDTLSASKLNENFQAVAAGIVPIGTILAWHKNLNGVPTLPNGWVECSGGVISDSASPMNGQIIPDLNGGARFLRGSATSGTFQADAFQGHNRSIGDNAASNLDWYYPAGVCAATNHYDVNGTNVTNTYCGQAITRSYLNDGTNGTPRTASETRPTNMSVVWIIRIK